MPDHALKATVVDISTVLQRGEKVKEPLCLKTALPEDIDVLMDLEHLGFEPGIREQRETLLQRLLTFAPGCFLAMNGRAIVGCVFTEIWKPCEKGLLDADNFALDPVGSGRHDPTGSVLYVASLTLRPEFRGAGKGKELFRATLCHMKEGFPQIRECVLLVNEDWAAARRIYQDAGFLVEGRLPGFFRPLGKPPTDGVVMRIET